MTSSRQCLCRARAARGAARRSRARLGGVRAAPADPRRREPTPPARCRHAPAARHGPDRQHHGQRERQRHHARHARLGACCATGSASRGTAPPRDAGKTVVIERLGHETNWQWAPTVHATVACDGSFSAVWHDQPHRSVPDPRADRSQRADDAQRQPPRPRRRSRSPCTARRWPPGTAPASTASGPRAARS